MDHYAREIEALLNEHGAVLLREHGHRVYKLPNGGKFTMSKTSSDVRSNKNALSDLRKILGVKREIRHRASPRKESPHHEPVLKPFRIVGEVHPSLSRQMTALAALEPRIGQKRKERAYSPRKNAPTVYTPTPAVLQEANHILETQGEKAAKEFLDKNRRDFTVAVIARKTQETPMSTLDKRVEASRIKLAAMETTVQNCQATIARAEKEIEQAKATMAQCAKDKVVVMDFIAAWDLVNSQAESIDKIVPSHLIDPPAKEKGKRGRQMGAAIISVAETMLKTRDTVLAVDVFKECRSLDMDVEKSTVHGALGYSCSQAASRIVKAGPGTYKLKVSPTPIRSSAVNGAAAHA